MRPPNGGVAAQAETAAALGYSSPPIAVSGCVETRTIEDGGVDTSGAAKDATAATVG